MSRVQKVKIHGHSVRTTNVEPVGLGGRGCCFFLYDFTDGKLRMAFMICNLNFLYGCIKRKIANPKVLLFA